MGLKFDIISNSEIKVEIKYANFEKPLKLLNHAL